MRTEIADWLAEKLRKPVKHRAAAIEAPPGLEDTSGDADWNLKMFEFLSMPLKDLYNS